MSLLVAKSTEAPSTPKVKADEAEAMTADKIVAMAKSEDGYKKVNNLTAKHGLALMDNAGQVPRMKSWLGNKYSGHVAVLAEIIKLLDEKGVKVTDTGEGQPALINITASVKDGGVALEVEYAGLGDKIYKPNLTGDKEKIKTALMGALIERYIEKGGEVKGKTIDEMFNSIVESTKKK